MGCYHSSAVERSNPTEAKGAIMPVPDTGLQPPAVYRPPRVVAVASGRDGVGKSSIVANLGLTLAKAGRRVSIWDFDSGPGNVLFLLGLQPKHKAEQLLLQHRALGEVLSESHHGLSILASAGTLGQHGPLTRDQETHLADQIETLVEKFDGVLLDCCANGGVPPAFVAAADLILLVLTPDAACLADTSELVLQLEKERSAEYHVLVNRVASQNEAWEVFNRFGSLVQEHSESRLRLLGFVPRDESLSAAAMLQRPVALFPDSDPSARIFLRLADALDRAFARLPAAATQPTDAWMRRLRMLTALPRSARVGATPSRAATPGEGTEALDRTLDQLRERILAAPGDAAEAANIADWVESMAQAYWDRWGEPPIDLPKAVARLIAEPGHEIPLARIRETMATLTGAARLPASGSPAAPDHEPATVSATVAPSTRAADTFAPPATSDSMAGTATRGRAVLTSEEVAEIQRVWAMDSQQLDRHWESPVLLAPEPDRSAGRTLRAHSIDLKRFGPQQQIIAMLRERAPSDEPLADWLRRVGAGTA